MRAALVALALLCVALPAAPAHARPRRKPAAKSDPQADTDPTHWFATRQGLIRVYQERSKDAPRKAAKRKGRKPPPPPPEDPDAAPHAGASCEVVESHARDSVTSGSTRESCTMIVGRMPKGATQLTYELRATGIFMVRAQQDGQDPQDADRLMLPAPIKPGVHWAEPGGAKITLERTVRSVGRSCEAAGRTFGDCLVLGVVQKKGARVLRKYGETYAAGVGLVEDAQWELIDVKGL